MGILLILVLLFLAVFPLAVIIFIIIPFFFGASYETSTDSVVQTMIKFSAPLKGKKAVDLGSGNGKIVIAFAKAGVKEAHGFEINPLLVLYSRNKIKKLNLEKKAFIHWKSFWKQDLSKFNIATVFQIGYIMSPLYKKLKRENFKGLLISNKWKVKNRKYDKKEGNVYFYKF
jgi:16S rRNA A1518/A1519 N6-dimethyltransferase RsmA/KsgA/DIM1 with predicted DNA glycosylase/AP lyase activity